MATPTISSVEFNVAQFRNYDATQGMYVNGDTIKGNLYTVEGVTDPSTGELRQLSMAELVMVICLARAAEKEKAVIDLMKTMSDNTAALEALTEIETKLLNGQSLNTISGDWTYNGKHYTRADSLLGALGVVSIDDNKAKNLESLQAVADVLSDGTSVFTEGWYKWDGYYRNKYGILSESGSLAGTYNARTAEDAYAQAAMLSGENRPLTAEEKTALTGFGVSDEVLDMTADQASYALEQLYYNGTVKAKIQERIQQMPIMNGTVTTEQLITDIESKMDSLNSFSQQKMIELQSETNKRDQSYDLVTNIIKSLNTVEVGIVNNI